MARAIKATKVTKPTAKAPPAKSSLATKRPPTAKASAPRPGKEELRATVEKLEQANATLRAKNREAGRTGKAAAMRVAELEAQVEQLERKAASTRKAATPKAAAPKAPAKSAAVQPEKKTTTRAKRKKAAIDPGDAVPPGVAAAEPSTMDETATLAKESLEENLKAG